MSSPKMLIRCLRTELRWATSAHALIGRPDRVYNLRKRLEQVDARRAAVEEAYSELEDLEVEKGVLESCRADYEQFLALTDDLIEAGAKDAEREREARLSSLLESPRKPSAQPELLGRLPTLDLPRFSGVLSEWMTFVGLFDSLVDARRDLTPCQKMGYLLASLEGEALSVVGHLKLSDDAYQNARDLLAGRYANVRRIADDHVRRLLNLPLLKDRTRLREDIVNPVVVACNSLRRLDLPVDEWSFLLLHIVLSRLPLDLRLHFEERFGGDGASYMPPFRDLLRFLEEQCRLLENAAGAVEGPPASSRAVPRERRSQPAKAAPTPLRPSVAPAGGRPPVPSYSGLAAREAPPCSYCRASDHRTASCPKLLRKPAKARRTIARERRWCFSCLERHLQRDCPHQRPCTHCQGNHNVLLCLGARGSSSQGPASPPTPTGGGAQPRPLSGDARRSPADRSAPPSEGSPSPDRSGSRSPRGGGVFTPPPRVDSGFAATQRSARPFSPPLAEWPRLERRPPPFGRCRYYRVPETAYRPRALEPRIPEFPSVGPFGEFQSGVIETPSECRARAPRFGCRPNRGSSR
ncbi:unnamed protein product [Parnassius mnemosyne]|uniref:Uncharacterized protein n=1 Tax=Parnassius mnemosyne TaxID=213953 RepID=A0AAV1KSD9_9NEOP